MKALRVHEWSVLPTLDDVDDPIPIPGHTIVRVAAATVGHVDRTIWSGGFLRHPSLPYTPGVEAAGVVVASSTFTVGHRVWVRGGGLGTATNGTWAQFVNAPDAAIGALPDSVSDAQGAAFFSPCTSAHVALHDIGQLQAGQTVIVTGASGAVGGIACQLAVAHGARVIATVSRPERLAALPPGVDGVVVRGDGPDPSTTLDAPLDGVPVADLLVDTVGGGILAQVLPLVVPGGKAVLVGYLAGERAELNLPSFMQRDVSVHPLNMIRREAQGRAAAPALLALLGAGRLHLDVTEFAMRDAAAALTWLSEPGHKGRAVLRLPAEGTSP